MKKNQKGFFLAETIIMIALITTVVAFVFPNVSKLYENFVNRTKYYDQTEDVFFLKAVGECLDNNSIQRTGTEDPLILNHTIVGAKDITNMGTDTMYQINGICNIKPSYVSSAEIYVAKYMATPSNADYEFNKFLHRLKKTNNDTTAHRIIARFKFDDGSYRYASVKYIFKELEE